MTLFRAKSTASSKDTSDMTTEKNTKMHTLKKWLIGVLLPVALILIIFLFQKILVSHPAIGEAYAKGLFRVVSFIPAKLSSLVPISLTEITIVSLVLSAPLIIAWLIIRAVRAHREKRSKVFYFKLVRFLAWLAFAIYATYMLLYGINFTRYPLEESLGFGQRQYTVDEICEVYAWVVDNLNEARLACEEDERGVVTYPGGYNALLKDLQDLYEESAKNIPEISGNSGRPKPVALSHYWSYTNIVGMFFPFYAEVNVNTDAEMAEEFFTACHELSHLHGFAVENDANFAAMLIGMNSSCPQLRYAGFSWALDLIEMDLYEAFNNDTDGLHDFLSQHPLVSGYFRDLDALSEYWAKINPPKIVSEVSTATNDTFLKMNQQEDGEKSYQMPTSNVADYYFTRVKKA